MNDKKVVFGSDKQRNCTRVAKRALLLIGPLKQDIETINSGPSHCSGDSGKKLMRPRASCVRDDTRVRPRVAGQRKEGTHTKAMA